MTIRPSYRWNGTRSMDPALYRETADFLDRMGISYVHMRDGRELPGCNMNPLREELESPHFLGSQQHELDGQYVYWGVRDITDNLSEQMFYDLYLRAWAVTTPRGCTGATSPKISTIPTTADRSSAPPSSPMT